MIASAYVNELFVRLVPSIKNLFNDFYGTDFSECFWKTSVMAWGIFWLGILYDRYSRIVSVKSILSTSEKLKVNILNDSCHFHVYDCLDMLRSIYRHDYNLILYSKIIRFMEPEFLEINVIDTECNRVPEFKPSKTSLFSKIYGRFCHCVFPTDIYWGNFGLTRIDVLVLRLLRRRRTRMKIENQKKQPKKTQLNMKLINFDPQNIFEEIVKFEISRQFPVSLLSGIPLLSGKEKVKYWIGNDIYDQEKCFKIARILENGGEWISVQHGGNYGQKLHHIQDHLEIEQASQFISWGWSNPSEAELNGKLVPMPSPRLSLLPKHKNNNNGKILLVGTLHPPHFFKLHSNLFSDDILPYLKERLTLLDNLDQFVKDSLVYKPYVTDYGTGIDARIIKEIGEDNVLSPNSNLPLLMSGSKLIIVDYLGTAFLECLAIDVPTILLLNTEYFPLRREAIEYFDLLRKVGVYHQSPIGAAEQLNRVAKDPITWWKSPDVIRSVKIFKDKYAKSSIDYLRSWMQYEKSLP